MRIKMPESRKSCVSQGEGLTVTINKTTKEKKKKKTIMFRENKGFDSKH